ncbi:MAG: ribosome maturation factor RimM [bacterium]
MGRGDDPNGSFVCPPGLEANGLLIIGKVLKTKGIRGQVKVLSYAASPDTMRRGGTLYVASGSGYRGLTVEQAEVLRQGSVLVLKFRECNRTEEAQGLVGAFLHVAKRDLPAAAEDEYYWHELIGLEVVTESGRSLGSIRGIFQTGSNDVYVIREGEREILIPGLREVVRRVDLTGRRMIIHPLEGLLDPHDL